MSSVKYPVEGFILKILYALWIVYIFFSILEGIFQTQKPYFAIHASMSY